MTESVLLAGKLNDLGNSWLAMFGDWANKGLPIALSWLVIIELIRRGSLKAGIGALVAVAIALGLYAARFTLGDVFEDEIKHPVNGAPAAVVVVDGDRPVPPVASTGSPWGVQ